MNYKEMYLTGVGHLEKAGIAEAKLDARLLLEAVCHTDRNTLLAHPELEVTSEQRENYVNYIEARAAHNPLQYITGVQDFMGLEFYVNQNVLIPRQDTEILVEEVMPYVHDGMHILDMCTGSGCILISLLQYSNHCAGVGIDLSSEALEVAAQNAERILSAKGMRIFGNNVHWMPDCERLANDEVYFVQGDLFAPLRQEKFDILVSNPPYIASAVIPTLEPEVAEHEPRMALDGKEDGLFFYQKIIASAGQYLYRGGMLFFEIGYDQGEIVSGLMADAGFHDIEVKKDYAGLDRVVFGTFLED
jgi:release factor glutamine methyltransferase